MQDVGFNRIDIEEYLDQYNKPPSIPLTWWILACSVKCFMEPVDECFRSAQGKDKLIMEHNARLELLCSRLKTLVGIEGPMSGFEMLLETDSSEGRISYDKIGVSGTFVVKEESVFSFLEDAYSRSTHDLERLGSSDRRTALRFISDLFLHVFVKVSQLRAERLTDNSSAVMSLPPVLPFQLFKLRRKQFYEIIALKNIVF